MLRARKWICIVSCIPLLAGVPAVFVASPSSSLTLICVALFGFASWSTTGLTLPSDLFSPEVVGSVTGLSGLAAGLSGGFIYLASRNSGGSFLVCPCIRNGWDGANFGDLDRGVPDPSIGRNGAAGNLNISNRTM